MPALHDENDPSEYMTTPELRLEQEYEAHMDAAMNNHSFGDDESFVTALERAEAIGSTLDPPRDAQREFDERIAVSNDNAIHQELADREDAISRELQAHDEPGYSPSSELNYDLAKDCANIMHRLDEFQQQAELTKGDVNSASGTAIEVEREFGIYKENHKHEVER